MMNDTCRIQGLALCLVFSTYNAQAEIIPTASPVLLARADFDVQALKNNGLDPVLAEYFANAPLFTPGSHNVSLTINGSKSGTLLARFTESGQLCADKDFLKNAGLKQSIKKNECPQLQQYWTTATVTLKPETDEVEIVVPPEALDEESRRQYADISGGFAGLLNYSAFGSHYYYDKNNSDNFQATLEMGFNAGDWIVRSTQILTDGSNERFNSDSLYTYAQRTFSDYGVMFQGGEINIANSRFSAPTLYGIQLMPDNTLLPREKSDIDVTGIARTAQARVEIRQGSQLIYSTLVPAGPFTLTDVPVINGNTDLKVKVVENDGSESTFTVAAASFRGNSVGRPTGFSLSAGRAKELDTRFTQPWVVAASNGWSVTRRVNFYTGMIMADNHYYGFSANIDTVPLQNLRTSLGFLGSIDNRSQTDGDKATLDISYALPYNLGVSLGGSYGTPDYREMSELYDDDHDFSPTKYDASVGVTWSHDVLGFFSVNYYRSEAWDQDFDSRHITTSWSKTFRHFSVNVNWQSDVSHDTNSDGDMVYASISIPLGRGTSSNTWYREREGKASYGSRVSGSINNNNSYTVGASRDHDDNTTSWDTSLNSNLRYTNLSLAASGDDRSNYNYSAYLRGGVVAHSDGVTFSPYAVNDTFAIIALDKPVAGVEIGTPTGSVWTDTWGRAIAASLSPYQHTSLNLNTQSLPGNIDVNNGKAILKASHGAVAKWQFTTLSQRRILLTIVNSQGKPLPKGTAIVNRTGEYVTTVPEDGMIFLNDISADQTLYAKPNQGKCRLNFILPEADPEKFYEEIAGTCLSQ